MPTSPLTILALPDWETAAPEQLLEALLAQETLAGTRLRLGIPAHLSGDVASLADRLADTLARMGLRPEETELEIELFVAPQEVQGFLAELATAHLFWSEGCRRPDFLEAARQVDARVFQGRDAAALEIALWLAQPLDPDRLACYDPEAMRQFCTDHEAIRLQGLRIERALDGDYWVDLIAYHPRQRSRMIWQLIKVPAADGSPPAFPRYMEAGPAELLERLAAEIRTQLPAMASYPGHAALLIQIPSAARDEIPDLDNAGDGRLTPGFSGCELFIHSAKRYRFAQHLGRGKKVLDLSCGSGYGTRMLAQTASEVVGCDVDAAAIAFGRETYGAPNLTRQVIPYITASTPLPFAGGSFDLVTNFEVLEHVPWDNMATFLAEIKRILTPEGTLIISTPNKAIYRYFPDPNHISLLTAVEFEGLLRSHFETVQVFSQRKSRRLDLFGEFDILPGATSEREVFLAVCRGPKASATQVTLVGRADPLSLLTFSHPAANLEVLARTGHHLDVLDRSAPPASGVIPEGVTRLEAEADAIAKLRAGEYDVAICRQPEEVALVRPWGLPVVMPYSLPHEEIQDEWEVLPLLSRWHDELESAFDRLNPKIIHPPVSSYDRTAIPLDLHDTKSCVFLARPHWKQYDGWAPVVEAYLSAFTARDDVSLVLWPPQGSADADDEDQQRLLDLIERLGFAPDDIPDVILPSEALTPDRDAGLYTRSDAVLSLGYSLVDQLARLCGRPVIHPPTGMRLRAFYEAQQEGRRV